MSKPVRRNIAHLTDAERTKYINAVAQADQRFWSGGVVSYWDFQNLSHQTTHVHGGPKFLLWHRELCASHVTSRRFVWFKNLLPTLGRLRLRCGFRCRIL